MNQMLAKVPAALGQILPHGQLNVLLISGSMALMSHTRWLADLAAAQLRTHGGLCTVWDLAQTPLPMAACGVEQEPASQTQIARVGQFLDAVYAADVVVLATPVYHGSYSGTLKNAIDHLRKGAFSGKVIGLVSHGSSASTSSQPLEHLRPVATNLHGHPLPTQLATCDADFTRDRDGALVDVDGIVFQRIQRMAIELASLSQALKLLRAGD